VIVVEVHSVISNAIAGFGYEAGTLRIVFKGGKAWDYTGVTQEDAGYFAQNFGKALPYIKAKYKGDPVPGTFHVSE